MMIPITVGGRGLPRSRLSAPSGPFWRGLVAAVRSLRLGSEAQRASSAPAADGSDAFINLFAQYHQPLLDYLYCMTRDREQAADLAQDTFVRAWTAAPDLAGIVQPRAWLYRIATNVALNAARHRRHFEWVSLRHEENESGGEAAGAWAALPSVEPRKAEGDFAANVAERDAVWTVLADLPPRWRAVLLLQSVAGFEVREIAALLKLSEVNVRTCHYRAKERFRALPAARREGGAG